MKEDEEDFHLNLKGKQNPYLKSQLRDIDKTASRIRKMQLHLDKKRT